MSEWIRRIAPAPAASRPSSGGARSDRSDNDIRAAVQALPAMLDGTTLPNGVVELVVEDLDGAARELFDIHDGKIASIEPGQSVPWTSIAGSPVAWAQALGPGRDRASLRLTGDQRLARAVLAALPERA